MEKQLEKDSFTLLKETVVEKGLCVGCGTCVGVCATRVLGIKYVDGEAEPYLTAELCPGNLKPCSQCLDACPGKDIPMLELEKMVFGKCRNPQVDEFGIYQQVWVAHANNEAFRSAGASGGTASAILAYAIDSGIAEAAIVGGFNDEKPYLQEGKLVRDSSLLSRYARSKHGGACPANALLSRAVFDEGITRLVVIGPPCHVHALRKIQKLKQPRKIADSLKLVLGVFCGSTFYQLATKHLLKEWLDISLDEVAMVDYRWKPWPGGFYVRTKDGREAYFDRYEYTFRKFVSWIRDRCTICIDHGSELADISFGDYWYAGAKTGDPGRNMVVVRSDWGREVFEGAVKSGYVTAEPSSTDSIARAGRETKIHAGAFRRRLRRRYGLPLPEFGFELSGEPTKDPQSYGMPGPPSSSANR